MAFDLDESELIATRVNNKTASWKEVEEYIEKYYVKKDKIREKIEEVTEYEDKDSQILWTENEVFEEVRTWLNELLEE